MSLFLWIYQTGFILYLSDEDLLLGLPWVNVSSRATFQQRGTDVRYCFLLPFFCTVSGYCNSWFFLSFIVHNVHNRNCRQILTYVAYNCYRYLLSKNTSWNKIIYMVKETLISWGRWWKSSFMALQFSGTNIQTNIFMYV